MQGDVYRNPNTAHAATPFLIDIQADLLRGLDTRMVAPLVRAVAFGQPIRGLHPRFMVAGQDVVMVTHLLAAIRRSQLGEPIASLSGQREDIVAAIDVLLGGV